MNPTHIGHILNNSYLIRFYDRLIKWYVAQKYFSNRKFGHGIELVVWWHIGFIVWQPCLIFIYSNRCGTFGLICDLLLNSHLK